MGNKRKCRLTTKIKKPSKKNESNLDAKKRTHLADVDVTPVLARTGPTDRGSPLGGRPGPGGASEYGGNAVKEEEEVGCTTRQLRSIVCVFEYLESTDLREAVGEAVDCRWICPAT